MKESNVQQDIGGTTACIKRITKDAKGCDQMSSNDTLFANIWLSRFKAAEEENAEGVDYFRPVKTSYKRFFLSMLEKLIK